MNIVGKDNGVTRSRTTSLVDQVLESVFGLLDVILVSPVIAVDVVIRNDVAEILHNSLAGFEALGVWWAHVRWVFANDVSDSHFSQDHLFVTLIFRNLIQVRMSPGVTGDLVALAIHSFDEVDPPGVTIESTTAIVSANEERALKAVLGQAVKDLASVDVGTVVECESDSASLSTCANTSTTVWDVALLWTWIVARASSRLTRL